MAKVHSELQSKQTHTHTEENTHTHTHYQSLTDINIHTHTMYVFFKPLSYLFFIPLAPSVTSEYQWQLAEALFVGHVVRSPITWHSAQHTPPLPPIQGTNGLLISFQTNTQWGLLSFFLHASPLLPWCTSLVGLWKEAKALAVPRRSTNSANCRPPSPRDSLLFALPWRSWKIFAGTRAGRIKWQAFVRNFAPAAILTFLYVTNTSMLLARDILVSINQNAIQSKYKSEDKERYCCYKSLIQVSKWNVGENNVYVSCAVQRSQSLLHNISAHTSKDTERTPRQEPCTEERMLTFYFLTLVSLRLLFLFFCFLLHLSCLTANLLQQSSWNLLTRLQILF